MNLGVTILLLALLAATAGFVWACGRGAYPHWPSRLRTPSGRAELLLRQILGTEEYRRLVRSGYLEVPSPTVTGRIYRIPYCPGRVEVIEQGGLIARLCVVSTSRVPAADMVLAHKLLIEGDEARYLRVANHFPARGARRIGLDQ